MPLIKSKSKEAFGKNMASEMDAGKPKAQSLAIAYSTQRHAKKKMAYGGKAEADAAPGIPAAKPDDMRPPMDQYMGEKWAKGGMVDIDDHYASIADAILKKKRMMAEGGQVDLEDNSEEHGNLEDDLSYAAIEKEQYDDSQISPQPADSNEMGDPREDDEENKRDMISAIRMKMKAKRAA